MRWAHPQLLAFAIAIPVAAAVLIIGQASDDETRARLRGAQIESATRTAGLIASSYTDRVLQIQNTLVALALTPRPDTSPIGLAVQRGDIATLQGIAETVQRLYPHNVVRVYIAVRGEADNIIDATIVAASSPGPRLIGRRLSDLDGPASAALRAIVGRIETAQAGFATDDYAGTPAVPAIFDIAATIPGVGRITQAQRLATIVTEIDDARTFADAAAPSLAAGDDAYMLMLEPGITGSLMSDMAPSSRPLIGRARGPTPFPWLDLSRDPFVRSIGPTSLTVAQAGVSDPLGAGNRLIATTPLSISSYSILFVRDTSAPDREVEAALSQLAIFRLVLAASLLGLAYLAGLAARQMGIHGADRERLRLARDLHDLLGHSLSLITIKSQLAGRLLSPHDVSRAAAEIADIETVARESLEDVRHAVQGYRQPSLRSALAEARAALAAAGIESTIDASSSRMPTSVDETLAWAVREGVTNVIRHSGAARCSIRLTRETREARLEITDNGATVATNQPGSGLRGLAERAVARGGRVDAGPLPDGGFRLHMSVPL